MFKTIFLMFYILAFITSQAQVNDVKIDTIAIEDFEIIDDFAETTSCYPVISKIPLYPGCERLKTRKEQQKCFADQIHQFINTEFSQKVNSNKDLPEGKIRIQTLFYIDTNGKPTKIRVKAPTHELEKETIRVISNLPKMKPALQRNRPVEYPVSIPIIIENKWK